MLGIDKERIESIKKSYPKGCRVKLISMSDMQAPPEGTKGTVMGVDDIGTIHVKWDNGSTLGVVLGEDRIRRFL